MHAAVVELPALVDQPAPAGLVLCREEMLAADVTYEVMAGGWPPPSCSEPPPASGRELGMGKALRRWETEIIGT